MRRKRPVKLCIQCGHARPLTRFTTSRTRCDFCINGVFRDTNDMRKALAWSRTQALRAMPYQVICAKCAKPRTPSYYPWHAGKAIKGDTCNSCLRLRKGRGGGRVKLMEPILRSDHIQRVKLARVLDREQARIAEQARTLAEGARCNDCWHHKPASAYRVDTRRRTGLCASCSECEALFRRLSPLGQWRAVRDALRTLVT